MSDAVRAAYDTRANEYTALNLGDLERLAFDRARLRAFARLVAPGAGGVADLGCGPGHVVAHLAELGVEAIGFDLSPAMIDEARRAFPGSQFQVGDLTSLGVAEAALAGIVARYSLIHLAPERLADVFVEWARALAPGAPALVSFFAADSPATHGEPFDHAVVTAHALFPETVVAEMEGAGFRDFEVSMRKPMKGERPLDHAAVLARRGGAARGRETGRAHRADRVGPLRDHVRRGRLPGRTS